MDASTYVVRAPAIQDAEALGRVHYAVWRATYAEEMTPSAYEALSPQRFEAGWRRRWEAGASPVGETTQVAEHVDEGIVGFISVGPARDEDAPTPRQLWVINVMRQHHGTGLADRLMAEVLGDGPAYLWVSQGNSRAIRFYHRHGFAEDGGVTSDQHDGITEIRMVRDG